MAIILQQQDCSNIANYADTEIPVTVVRDLTPTPGEFQTFCYIVTQVDEPIALSHWVLGICPTITIEDIGEVTVTINGDEQIVIKEGEGDNPNVEIFNPPDTDPQTGCPGLKFDFGLEEAGDVMRVCFELLTTYPVGPNNVCLFGGGETVTGESVCGPVCDIVEECETTVFQEIGVCVPITVTPFAEVGPIDVTCCGPATVSTTPCPTVGPTSCTFYIRRNICVEVPVSIGATGVSGNTFVTCGVPNQVGCDCNGNGDGIA